MGNECIDINRIAHLNPKLMFICQLKQSTFYLPSFIHQVGLHFKSGANIRIITITITPKEVQKVTNQKNRKKNFC